MMLGYDNKMRIRLIHIEHWRHFSNIRLTLDLDTALVCLVGANGTGKSHILELIAACAHHIGLSQGIEIPRGNPFDDPHKFTVTFYIAPATSDILDTELSNQAGYAEWNREITIDSERSPHRHNTALTSGGITDQNQSRNFASSVQSILHRSNAVHFVSLDADRAYPKRDINIHEIAQAYETQWDTLEWTKGRSFRTTRHLYDEWIKYFLAQENQAGSRLLQDIRRAREVGATEPRFTDHFANYEEAVRAVLPHLLFVGVDTRSRSLLFDTTGMHLTFDKLSGGEREIAFLIGQIDRFQLRYGLFLLDEPELHLNADLIRRWVSYLTGTVVTGQVWLATHSLEAVEAAGQEATFLLEKDPETKKVNSLARLDDRPVLSALSRAVGTPAFSLSQLRFVFVEGEDSVGERERFKDLSTCGSDTRFLPCGSCNEVTRRVSAINSLSDSSHQQIRIGGIIDRDFRSQADIDGLTSKFGVFALSVFEIENFFLHPKTIQALLGQNGLNGMIAEDIIRAKADNRAGMWVYQNAFAKPAAISLEDKSPITKQRMKQIKWSDLEISNTIIDDIIAESAYVDEDKEKIKKLLLISKASYEKKRQQNDFWKKCEGKEILNAIAGQIGFSNSTALMKASYVLWSKDEEMISEELSSLREYIHSV